MKGWIGASDLVQGWSQSVVLEPHLLCTAAGHRVRLCVSVSQLLCSLPALPPVSALHLFIQLTPLNGCCVPGTASGVRWDKTLKRLLP